jgi:hypothetical protein
MISRYLQSAAIGCDLVPRLWEQACEVCKSLSRDGIQTIRIPTQECGVALK